MKWLSAQADSKKGGTAAKICSWCFMVKRSDPPLMILWSRKGRFFVGLCQNVSDKHAIVYHNFVKNANGFDCVIMFFGFWGD